MNSHKQIQQEINLPIDGEFIYEGKRYRKTYGTYACHGCAMNKRQRDCRNIGYSCILPKYSKETIFVEVTSKEVLSKVAIIAAVTVFIACILTLLLLA